MNKWARVLFGGEKGFAMKRPMHKLAVACIATCAVLGGIGAASAQMHDGSHAGGGGLSGGNGNGSHEGGVSHGGGGFHGGGGLHHGGRFHGRRAFVGPPIIIGPGYFPYGYAAPYDYSYPYDDGSGSSYWYCGDPAGYYPDVQTCPNGWVQVVPSS